MAKKYNLENINDIKLITDDGSENKGDVNVTLKDLKTVIHQVSMSNDFPFSNSCIESFFHTFKGLYLENKHLDNYAIFEKSVIQATYHSNNTRLKPELGCKSLVEFLQGIDIGFSISKELKQASKNRLLQNQSFNCYRFCTINEISSPN